MANSAFLRSLIRNPTKITTNFALKSSFNLITRPFSSSESNPNSPIDTSNPPIEPVVCKSEKKLVEELFKARTEGLFVSSAHKVFERTTKRLRGFQNTTKTTTHQATEKSKAAPDRTPEVVAHIAVLEAYANAGLTNPHAYRVYLKMLGPGVIPNQYTYDMLVQLLAETSRGDWMMMGQAQRYLLEMMDKGLRPDPSTSVTVFKALAKDGRIREGKEFLEDLQRRGFVVDDLVFKEVLKGRGSRVRVLKGKGGPVIKTVLEMLFDRQI